MVDAFDEFASADLARLLEVDAQQDEAWSADDLRAILAHQLRVPLAFSRDTSAGAAAVPAAPEAVRCLGDLLSQAHPPVHALMLAKAAAKASLREPVGELPREVAQLLYYACTLAARLHAGQRISKLDDASLCRGVRWGLEQPWVDGRVRRLFEDGAAKLGC